MFADGKAGNNVSVNIEVAVNVRFPQGNLPVRMKQRTQRTGTVDAPGEPAELCWLRVDPGSVPQFDCEIARMVVIKQQLNCSHCSSGKFVADRLGSLRHGANYALT